MAEGYFIIRPKMDEAGADVDGPLSEGEVLKRITPDAHGDTYYGAKPRFCTEMPDFEHTEDGDNPVVVIRGEIVVPKAVKTVTQYKL